MDGAGKKKRNQFVLQEFSQITITMKYLNRVEISWIDLMRERKKSFSCTNPVEKGANGV